MVSDGKRGHEGQSRALAELMDSPRPQVITVRRPPPAWEPLLRLLSCFIAPSCWPRWLARSVLSGSFGEEALNTLERRLKENESAGSVITISTGTLAAIPALLLARELEGRSLHLMRPSLVPLRRFDLVLLPRHDVRRATGSAVLSFPFALGFTGEETLARCRETMRGRLGLKGDAGMPSGPYLTVLIGGSSAHFRLQPRDLLAYLNVLVSVAEEHSWRILLSTSRRTPEEVETALKQFQREHRDSIYFAVWARLDSFNPLPAFFDLSRGVVVTEDSVSMISEAILAGHRPLLLPLQRLRRSRKVERFQHYLERRKLARRVEDAEQFPRLLLEEVSQPRHTREEVATELGLKELVATIKSRLRLPL